MRYSTLLFAVLFYISLQANPIVGLLERIDLGLSEKFILTVDSTRNTAEDYFELYPAKDKIGIKANNYISMGVGINWYLKYYLNVHLTWNNMHVNLSSSFPQITQKERYSTQQTIRYHFNYCTFGYSTPFWGWERWEEEIDWLVLHGINTPLAIVGTEVVWYNVLKQLEYTAEEIDSFISGPAFLPWWAMNNLEAWGGPNSQYWYKEQEELQKKILNRMRSYGMNPVLPGYAGMVPSNVKEKLDFDVTNPGLWCGFQRPAFLQPTDPNFKKIAQLYYKELYALYGKTKYYSIDPFHEGGSIEGVDLAHSGREIMNELKKANPSAIWVIQAWQDNPRPQMINKVKKGDILVLDLWSESRPQWGDPNSLWYRKNGFGKHDWLYCNVHNFGNRTGLFGKMDRLIDSYYMAKKHTQGKTMKGIGMAMEGIENNPVMYELFYELPWHNEKIDKENWLRKYATFRYGKECTNAQKAWILLGNSVYNCPTIQEGTTESIFCARPDTLVKKVSCCSVTDIYYSNENLLQATQFLFGSIEELSNNKNLWYDLVDLMRQCITNKGLFIYNKMMSAYKERDITEFIKNKEMFLELILDQDKLLSTQPGFMLGTWLQYAKDKARSSDEMKLYEWNARTIITTWGNRTTADDAGLRDYSYREWNGMLKDFYYERWKMYLDMLSNLISGGGKFIQIDFYEWENEWTRKQQIFPTSPANNSNKIILEQYKKHVRNNN
jgi:alpha-N-acetylglucosaminidase